MSRIGEVPVEIPQGVTVNVSGNTVTCKGVRGELSYTLDESLSVQKDNGSIAVQRQGNDRRDKSLHGLARSMIVNMLEGVTKGFEKTLEIRGTGYRASLQGKNLSLSVGYSHPVLIEAPEGIEFEVPNATTIVVKGCDKQLVGQTAAQIRQVRKPEPYLGKGIRYRGEHVRRKEGKKAAK